MTVSASSTREFTRDEILRRAFQKAGLMSAYQSPRGPVLLQGADFLEMILDELQAEGLMVRTNILRTVTLATATDDYDLPADTLNVIGTAMVVHSSGGESPVQSMGQEQYQRLTNKDAAGTPTRYYCERTATVKLYLWPVPPATLNGTLLRYRAVRLFADADEGAATMSTERHWTRYLMTAVAHELAVANGIATERCGYLRSDALAAKNLTKGYSRPRGSSQIHVAHRGGYR